MEGSRAMSAHLSPLPATALARPHSPLPLALSRLWAEFLQAYAVALRAERSRGDLRRLDDRMLEDIGITRAQAKAEADRVPWQVP
jgi:uncharacterized protein YjiS (DUF1127 family)